MAKKELDLADILADSLNKQLKDQKVAFFLDSDELPQQMLKVGFRQNLLCWMLQYPIDHMVVYL